MKADAVKTTRQGADHRAAPDSSAGAGALAPPAYGIDFIDRGMPAAPPVQAAGMRAARKLAGPKEDEAALQARFDAGASQAADGERPNCTGLPDGLKAGIESLSGMDLSDVRVHANSAKPAEIDALAYAQGDDIHLGPGQEKHLPHEAWHVVQQRQGRVRPTLHLKGGIPANDDKPLEREADAMGERASGSRPPAMLQGAFASGSGARAVLQGVFIRGKDIQPDQTGNNEQVLGDCLDALIEAQEAQKYDPDSWLGWVIAINAELAKSGPTKAVLAEIDKFYQQAAELNFQVNHVLAEAWSRCMAATRNNSKYSEVGGKFRQKFAELLEEIAHDFPNLKGKVARVPTMKVNKEHMVNKGKQHLGSQTGAFNLMFAAAPPIGSTSTLSDFHKEIHKMKPGTGATDYSGLDPQIRKVIEAQQKKYDASSMGTFQ